MFCGLKMAMCKNQLIEWCLEYQSVSTTVITDPLLLETVFPQSPSDVPEDWPAETDGS